MKESDEQTSRAEGSNGTLEQGSHRFSSPLSSDPDLKPYVPDEREIVEVSYSPRLDPYYKLSPEERKLVDQQDEEWWRQESEKARQREIEWARKRRAERVQRIREFWHRLTGWARRF